MDVHLGNKMIQSIFSWLSIWFSSQVYFISSLKRTFVSPLCGIALMNLHLKSHLDIQDKKWSLRKSYFILIWWIVKNFNQFWPEITPVRAEGFLTIHLLSMVILALNRCARDIYIYMRLRKLKKEGFACRTKARGFNTAWPICERLKIPLNRWMYKDDI